MILSKKNLIKKIKSGNMFEYFVFPEDQNKRRGANHYSYLSNEYPINIAVDNHTYHCVEHYIMAKKARFFRDKTALKKILLCKTAFEAKKFGAEVKHYSQAIWERHCIKFSIEANLEKFSQHPELGRLLLSTGNKVLVNATADDVFWGIGLSADDAKASPPEQWQGQNVLGFELMQIRTQLSHYLIDLILENEPEPQYFMSCSMAQIKCPHCNYHQKYRVFEKYWRDPAPIPHFYCSDCSSVCLLRNHGGLLADESLEATSSFWDKLEKWIPPCPCGGHFLKRCFVKCEQCHCELTTPSRDPLEPYIALLPSARLYYS